MSTAQAGESVIRKQLIVIGGGAAGFFCAVNAARLNPVLQVIIVEKSNKLLSKVKVSGGGRCNVTHACFNIVPLTQRYPRGSKFLKKSFHFFNTTHCVQWFEERGVPLKTEADGRMFSITDSSQTIIDCLLNEAERYKVQVLLHREVKTIQQIPALKDKASFELTFTQGPSMAADYIMVATGGGPKSSMFSWLENLGHTIVPPVPSLFTLNMPGNSITTLMGVSVENARVKIVGSKIEQEGPLLITHWGMSGPAILKLSAWGARELADRNYRCQVVVNWVPQYNEHTLRDKWQWLRNEHAAQKTGNRNPFGLPTRLWIYLLNQSGINENIRWADLPGKEQNRLISNLTAQPFDVNGKTTFKEEFVTCGGIKLSEIDPQTMESRLLPNLYFGGEVMDVDGVTGGFNFQHAWTSGWIAAKAISDKASG